MQTALERQDLSCMYLAHHELEIVLIIIIIVIMQIDQKHTLCSYSVTIQRFLESH